MPARYGGEEIALVLPDTDLVGAFAIAIAERVRTASEALRIPRPDQQGQLRVTASLGVAASADGEQDELILDATQPCTRPSGAGKNRTLQAAPRTANVVGAE